MDILTLVVNRHKKKNLCNFSILLHNFDLSHSTGSKKYDVSVKKRPENGIEILYICMWE